jgi:hypothetical protein
MGYRSNVKALIYPDAPEDPMSVTNVQDYYTEKYEMLKVLMKTTFGHLLTDTYFDETYFEFDDKRDRLIFTAEDVKWYDGYADVSAFHKFLNDVTELGYCTEFIRIGEETDDIQQDFTGTNIEYRLSVSRSIEID